MKSLEILSGWGLYPKIKVRKYKPNSLSEQKEALSCKPFIARGNGRSYGDSAIQVRLRIYVDYADMFSLNWDLNKRIKKIFEDNNIEIPFAQLVLHKAP